MGIYSRDYIREEPRGGFMGGGGDFWAVKVLIAINVVVYLLQNMSGSNVTELFGLSLPDIVPGCQVWRLLTYGFCHDLYSVGHLAFNMLALWVFGRMVEPIYGPREFLAFYLTAIVASGLCFIGFDFGRAQPGFVVGASGGIAAIVVLCAMHFPKLEILLMFVIPIQLRWLAVLYLVGDLTGMLGGANDNIARAAHLGGAAFGFAYYRFGWKLMNLWPSAKNVRSMARSVTREKLRVYTPPPEDLDKQVDEILAKISAEGEASLSDRERQILKDASRRYKDR